MHADPTVETAFSRRLTRLSEERRALEGEIAAFVAGVQAAARPLEAAGLLTCDAATIGALAHDILIDALTKDAVATLKEED